MMKDQYANFTVQKAYAATTKHARELSDLRARLEQEIQGRARVLSRFTYGRHILSVVGSQGHHQR